MVAPMEVVSECPLTVGSVLWQSGPKAWTLTFVAKATFVLAPGESPLSSRSQEDVYEHDGHWDDDPTKSLTVAGDLAPFKRRPEVVIVGHAHAPDGKRIASLVTRLAMSTIDKAIEVRGDQSFMRDGALTDPAPFKRMPLRWERAAGGPDTSNPVGVPTGTEARFDSWGRCALPNLVPVGQVSQSVHDPVEPIGYGPIAPTWPPRLARLHGSVPAFRHDRWSASPLPENFDAAYFNSAPRDQQLAVFDGTESLLLENLHPRHPALATRLAPIRPAAAFEWGKGRRLDLGLACDTLHIDADRGLAMLTYRGHIALDQPTRTGRILVTLEPAHSPRASVPDWLHRVEDVVSTMAASEDEGGPTLPFSLSEDEAPTLPKRPGFATKKRTTTQVGAQIPVGPALPFQTKAPATPAAIDAWPFRIPAAAPPASTPAPQSATPVPQGATPAPQSATPSAPSSRVPQSVPQKPAQVPSAAQYKTPVPPSQKPAQVLAALGYTPPAPLSPKPAQVPSPPPGFATSAQALHAAARPVVRPAPELLPFVPPPTSPDEPPSPPPLVGAIAREQLREAAHIESIEETVDGDALVEEIEAAAIAEVEPAKAAPAAEEDFDPALATAKLSLPVETHPLDRCARIAASLSRRPDDRATILRAHELDEQTWTRLDNHYGRRMFEEAERQKNSLLKAYDAAFVAQLEEERGPLSIEEYARITVAGERSSSDEAMIALHLPPEAAMRIRRVWIARIARDMDFGARVRRALQAERDK